LAVFTPCSEDSGVATTAGAEEMVETGVDIVLIDIIILKEPYIVIHGEI
jgi:hypothetical protein